MCVIDVFFILSPRMLQPVRRHSAIVLTVPVKTMQQIHPVDIHSFSILSNDRSKASSKTIPPHSAI